MQDSSKSGRTTGLNPTGLNPTGLNPAGLNRAGSPSNGASSQKQNHNPKKSLHSKGRLAQKHTDGEIEGADEGTVLENASAKRIERAIKIPRVWRSQIGGLILFAILAPICVWLSHAIPFSVIEGPLFSFGDTAISLKLPLFWLGPASVMAYVIIKIYDVSYVLDNKGIESKIGILSLDQIITRIRYEDIRSIDSRQTITERMLGIGCIDIGTAASAGLEMSFVGIARPLEVQAFIQAERDARLRKSARLHDEQGNEETGNLAAGGE